MMIRILLLCFSAFLGSNTCAEPAEVTSDKIIELLETTHLSWLANQKNVIPMSDQFEFILRRQTGYEEPEAEYKAEIQGYNYSPNTKHFRGKLVFKVAGEKETKIYPLDGFAYPLIQVPALVTPLMAGSLIDAENLELMTIREDRLQPQMETKADQLIGMETVNSIQAHKPIPKRYIKSPRLIQKGEFVDITIKDGMIQLSAQGRALQSGGKGELISVMNKSSKKIVQGKVVGPRQVSMNVGENA